MPMPAKSQELHALQGTKPQAKDLPEHGVSSIPAGKPPVPKSLSAAARDLYRKLCKQLADRRVLTRGDCELLRIYATAWDRQRQADQALQREGLVVSCTRLDSNGQPHEVQKQNINLAIAERAEKQMVGILDRLGLTPIHREKVRPTQRPKLAPVCEYPEGSIGYRLWKERQEENYGADNFFGDEPDGSSGAN